MSKQNKAVAVKKNAVVSTAKKAIAKVKKAVAKVTKSASETIALTAKTWKADVTQTLIAFAWVHTHTAANIVERLLTSDSEAHKVGKTCVLLFRGARGTVARDAELDTTGQFARVRNAGLGGMFTGWFSLADVQIGGLKVEQFADAEALAKTFTVWRNRRKADGSGAEYACGMENDLTRNVYAASVRRVNGKLIAWHEEDRRNGHNAHEVSASESEVAKSAVLAKATARAKTGAKALVTA